MANKQLSAVQQQFVNKLFGAADGNLKEAATQCGIEDYASIMTSEMIDEIKRRADQELALNVPRAVSILNKILNTPEQVPFLERQLKCAESVLDRTGLSRQDRVQLGGQTLGLVFLPTKSLLPLPPPEEENITQ